MLLDLVLALEGDTLVDMGCGDGAFLAELAAEYVGVDLDGRALEEARRRFASLPDARVRLLCEDCRRTSLGAETADVAVYRMLLHHVERVAEALAEAGRILRRGGGLVIREGGRLAEAEYAAMNAQLARRGLPPEVHPGFAVEGLADALDGQGFRVERVAEDGTATFATPPYTDRVYAAPAFVLVARRRP